MQSDSGRSLGYAAALLTVLTWASWVPVTRLGVTTALTPLELVQLRFLVAGSLLAPILWLRRNTIPWHRPAALFWLVFGGGAAFVCLFGYGLRIANSGQGAVLGPGALSLNVALISVFVLGDQIGRQRWLGIGIVTAGVLTILLHDVQQGGTRVAGFAMIYAASVISASHTVASRLLSIPPLTVAALVSVGNLLVLLPLLFLGGYARLAAVPLHDLAIQIFMQGVMAAIVAMVAFNYAIGKLGANRVSTLMPLSLVLTAALGYWLLGDTVDVATALGLACVVIGVLVGIIHPKQGGTQPAQ